MMMMVKLLDAGVFASIFVTWHLSSYVGHIFADFLQFFFAFCSSTTYAQKALQKYSFESGLENSVQKFRKFCTVIFVVFTCHFC